MPNPERNTYQPDQLLAGDFPIIRRPGVIAAGQKLSRGSVLGELTAGGQFKLSASAGVLMLTGEVRGDALHLGAGHTVAGVADALRPLSLFVR